MASSSGIPKVQLVAEKVRGDAEFFWCTSLPPGETAPQLPPVVPFEQYTPIGATTQTASGTNWFVKVKVRVSPRKSPKKAPAAGPKSAASNPLDLGPAAVKPKTPAAKPAAPAPSSGVKRPLPGSAAKPADRPPAGLPSAKKQKTTGSNIFGGFY